MAVKPFSNAVEKTTRDGDNGTSLPRVFMYFDEGIKVGKGVPNRCSIAVQILAISFSDNITMIVYEFLKKIFGIFNKIICFSWQQMFISRGEEMVLEAFADVCITVENDWAEIFVGRNHNDILIVGKGV